MLTLTRGVHVLCGCPGKLNIVNQIKKKIGFSNIILTNAVRILHIKYLYHLRHLIVMYSMLPLVAKI